MSDTVLVTGGSGFLGSALVELLLGEGHEVVNYSKRTYAVHPGVKPDPAAEYKEVLGDVRDALKLHRALLSYEPTVVYHLAAETHVDRSFDYPVDFYEANVGGTLGVLEAIRALPKAMRPVLVHMSTDEVFGDVPDGHYCREEEPLNPQNPYSAAKAAAEHYVRAWGRSFGLEDVIARSMNNLGPRQHPEKLVAKICARLLSGTPFTLYQGGSVRGWIHSEDTARALQVLGEKGRSGETYHIPPAGYATVEQVAQLLIGISGRGELFQGYRGRRLKDDERYALDGTKMRTQLGFEPRYSLKEALERTYEWFRSAPWFWSSPK